ncbi:hypothetical protein ACGCUQ_04505 [Eubacteriales bacterium KG127]
MMRFLLKRIIIKKSGNPIKLSNKKGVYLIEAAILLPLFILGIVAIISIIPAICKSEEIIFQCVDEMRLECVKTQVRNNNLILPFETMNRVSGKDKAIRSFIAYNRIYRGKSGHMDEMIDLNWSTTIKQPTLTGLFSNIKFKGKLISRGFVGFEKELNPTPKSEFDKEKSANTVIIFPNEGRKYHGKSCRTLRQGARAEILTRKFKKSHKPCKLCKSKNMPIMSQVYVINDSRTYHRKECSQIKRNYIEIDKSIAESRNYEPCKICGGQ